MPTPSSLISGARSYTRQAMPRSFRFKASVSPQMPPPKSLLAFRRAGYQGLERFYFHLAEFDRAGPVLQGDRTFVKHAVAQLCRRLSIQHDSDVAAVRGHLICIPLAARFRHRTDFDVTRDRAGAIARIRTLVEDIGFVAGAVGYLLRIEATEIDSAIGIIARPEFGAHDEILVRLLAHQIAGLLARHLVDDNGAVLDTPVGFADLIPSIEAFAVEQGNPACLLAHGFRRERAAKKAQSGQGKSETDRTPRCDTHGVSSLFKF